MPLGSSPSAVTAPTALDCSANPNYPAAALGARYRVTVAGKIGGASGTVVEAGDVAEALATNAGGTQSAVGSSWMILQANIAGMTAAGLAMIQAADATAQGALLSLGNIPQNSQSAAYTTVLTDAGTHIYHPGADTTARTWTIAANASVAYPIGTAITFVNDTSAGVITIAINSDTMILAGAGTTGSRTLAANGIATAIKITSTRWIISGTGLT